MSKMDTIAPSPRRRGAYKIGFTIAPLRNRMTAPICASTGVPKRTLYGDFMSHFAQTAGKVLPTAIGGGILGISIVGLGAAAIGIAVPLAIEALSALAGALIISFSH